MAPQEGTKVINMLVNQVCVKPKGDEARVESNAALGVILSAKPREAWCTLQIHKIYYEGLLRCRSDTHVSVGPWNIKCHG